MARLEKVDLGNSIEAWRQKTNLISSYLGDLDDLNTDDSSTIVGSLNSIEAKVVTAGSARTLISGANAGAGSYVSLGYNNTTGVITLTRAALLTTDIPNLDASKITTGAFGASRISSVDATTITLGTVAVSRLPNLDASKITTGTFADAQLSSLSVTKLIGGTIAASHIPNITAEKVIHGSAPGDAGAVNKSALPTDLVYTGGSYNGSTPQTITSAMTFEGVNLFGDSAGSPGGTITANKAAIFNSTVQVNDHVSTTTTNTLDIGTANNKFANVFATTFQGNATSANYADLAEKYTTDDEYLIGTVMMVNHGPNGETTKCTTSSIPVGVISEKPAFLMNSEAEGKALALKGRVPVRVCGPIRKGEAVYTYHNGCASVEFNGAHIIGVALESNDFEGEKMIECVLKL